LADGLAEKVSRLKLKHGSAEGLGTFEALEFLVLVIHGKWALWRALSVVAGNDSRLQGTDFDELTARAKSQHERVDERRLTCSRSALGPNAERTNYTRPETETGNGRKAGARDTR